MHVSESAPPMSDTSSEITWLPSAPRFAAGETMAMQEKGHRAVSPQNLMPGDLFGDFLIRRELGRGAVGVVYLAEQISLRRAVALKISQVQSRDVANREGSALASLDHPSIVRVYSESVEPSQDCRVLCMQYVPGLTLRKLFGELRQQFGEHWCGRDLLMVLDQGISEPVVMDAASIQERAMLEQCNRTEAVCWLGSQLAAALDYAHRCGIVHGDIKPENIVVNQFGRPMLVDFNLARHSLDIHPRVIGGTVPYMSPESLSELLEVIHHQRESRPDEVKSVPNEDALNDRSDMYSLGIVLWEALAGSRPFAEIDIDTPKSDPDWKATFETQPAHSTAIPESLRIILRRAFHCDPKERFATGKEFAANLVGAAQQTRASRSTHIYGAIGYSVTTHPARWLTLAGFVPHVCASCLQVTYNQAQVASLQTLTPQASETYNFALIYLNLVMYGVSALVAFKKLRSALPPSHTTDDSTYVQQMETSRSRLLRLPRDTAVQGAFGWALASALFPIFLHLYVTPLRAHEFVHLICSFLFACAIAVTYAYGLMMAVVVVGFYCRVHGQVSLFRQQAARELIPISKRWSLLSWLAGAIPLTAANVLVLTQTVYADGQINLAFSLLIVSLIVAGAAGFAGLGATGRQITQVMERCAGVDPASFR